MKKRHVNIPIFIPHLGCPNACVFCNQRTISGHGDFKIETVRDEIEAALSTLSPDTEREIAFFGGSFTGIDRTLMIELLDLAEEYVSRGLVSEIRLSTRPDYINDEILAILSRYGVRTVELGIQSTSDEVLLASKRGHTADVSWRAAAAIKAAGFNFAHTYDNTWDSEFLAAARKYGFKLWVAGRYMHRNFFEKGRKKLY